MKKRTRVLIIALLVIFILIGGAIRLGQGPFVEIPEDAEIGKEYPFENEEAMAIELADFMQDHIEKTYASERVLRDAHPIAHGCVHGEFRIQSDIPPEMSHGLFARQATYPVWIRFSNGRALPDTEGNVRGMAIKLMGVDGPKLQNDEKYTQDFLLITSTIMPVGAPDEYLKMFQAFVNGNPMGYFFGGSALPWKWRLSALSRIRKIASVVPASPLAPQYFSATPYLVGDAGAKFSAKPCTPSTATIPEDAGDRFLRETMREELANGDACFEFMIQLQTDPIAMPIEDAAVEWSEDRSPFVPVAHIHIPAQSFDSPAQDEFCENLTFNPWHALEEHRPLGAINRMRKTAYDQIARYRLEQNDIQRVEPNGSERF